MFYHKTSKDEEFAENLCPEKLTKNKKQKQKQFNQDFFVIYSF